MRLLPGHLPDDLSARLWLLPDADGPAVGPFGASLDLFGDGSLCIIELPGHAEGQIGLLVRRRKGSPCCSPPMHAGRAQPCRVPSPAAESHELIAHDRAAQRDTYGKLQRLLRAQPELLLVPSHCPDAARELLGEGPSTSSRRGAP